MAAERCQGANLKRMDTNRPISSVSNHFRRRMSLTNLRPFLLSETTDRTEHFVNNMRSYLNGTSLSRQSVSGICYEPAATWRGFIHNQIIPPPPSLPCRDVSDLHLFPAAQTIRIPDGGINIFRASC